jgi:hypothetical protein
MDISKQEKRLMLLIEDYRENECQKLLSSAHKKVALILQKAFHKAREYVHTTIVSERQRSSERIHLAQAELETHKRKHERLADAMVLELGRERIKQQLLKSWHDNHSRQLWISNAFLSALKYLPHGNWQIHHPVGWSIEESQQVIEMPNMQKVKLFFQSDTKISCGIKIEVASTVLDMTAQGLLADEHRLESKLLALYYQVSSL